MLRESGGESDALLRCMYVRHNRASIVRASGEIDLPNVHLLAEMLDVALGDGRPIIVDLTGVSNIDSTGLNVLVQVHGQCARRRTNMAVVLTSRNLWRIFSVLSLQDVFRIFPTVDAAIGALSGTEGLGHLRVADVRPFQSPAGIEATGLRTRASGYGNRVG